jgi:PIN domain nuclease of toxin-antitoxin system
MSAAILDSSAVLAVILEEPGAERVEAYLPGAKLSAVNLGEIVAKLRDLGMPAQTVEAVLDGLQIDVRPHDRDAALSAGLLRPATRAAGLSLGDRACLALAASLGLPAVTADRSWQGIAAAIGVQVASIR